MPSVSERAKLLAKAYGITIVEAEDIDVLKNNITDTVEDIIKKLVLSKRSTKI